MGWDKHTFRGVEYTFDHLLPFTMIVDGLRVRVKPGAHVFCKDVDPADPDDLKFMDGKTERTFCPVRYGLSISLGPTLIAASAGYVYEGKRGKFVFKLPLPPPQGLYLIAFEMWRCKAAALRCDLAAQQRPRAPVGRLDAVREISGCCRSDCER